MGGTQFNRRLVVVTAHIKSGNLMWEKVTKKVYYTVQNFVFRAMFKTKSLLKLLWLIIIPIFLSTLKAAAGLLGDYTASSEPKKIEQRRTVGSGSRSDCESNISKNSVTLLVPEAKVVHQTASSRPSFFLYSTIESSVPFKFTIVNPQVAEPIVEKTFSVSRRGIKQIELPSSTKLKEGTVYLWYVAIPCSNVPRKYQ